MARLAEYGFNEGTGSTAADSSGNARDLSGGTWDSGHGGAAGGPTWSGALGAGSVSSYTMMGWLRIDSGSGTVAVPPGAVWNFTWSITTTAVTFEGGSGEVTGPITAGVWTHVAVQSNGTNVRIFIDGVQQPENWASSAMDIGSGSWSLPDFPGAVDEFRVFDTMLSQAEIATWMDTPIGGGSTSTTHDVSGAVAATSSTTGAVTRAPRIHAVSGVMDATSATSGSVTRVARVLAVAGVVAAASVAAGAVTAILPTSGTVAAASGASGSASVITGPVTHPAAGVVVTTSGTTGTVTGLYPVAGTVTAVSGVTGAAQALGPTQEPPLIVDAKLALTANHSRLDLDENLAVLTLAENLAAATLTENLAELIWRYDTMSKSNVNDTWPPAELVLMDGTAAVDLTGATSVEFHMAPKGGAIKVNAAAEVTDAPAGAVRYLWQPGDTDTAGAYLIDCEVTWADGSVQTFPPGPTRPTWTFTAELDPPA